MLTKSDLEKIEQIIDSSIDRKVKPLINNLRADLKSDIVGLHDRITQTEARLDKRIDSMHIELTNEIQKNRKRIEHNAKKINKTNKTLNTFINLFDTDLYKVKKFVEYKPDPGNV